MTGNEVLKKGGRAFWDTHSCGGNWGNYRGFMEWIQQTEPYAFEVLKRYDWAGTKVLDVGCGQGTVVNYLPRHGARMVGLDMSVASLHRAAMGADELGYADRVRLCGADAERLPFTDACFDRVLSFGVLHHTPDTAGAVRELYRVLKPGGLAIVMLYRSGNPKWWMTRGIRGVSRLVDLWTKETRSIANRLRARQGTDDPRGTALLELFGVPILKAFSNRQAYRLFDAFAEVRISNHQPGFRRLADIVTALKPMERFLQGVDRRVEGVWGFYQVIEARK